jgi:hypothetical protein
MCIASSLLRSSGGGVEAPPASCSGAGGRWQRCRWDEEVALGIGDVSGRQGTSGEPHHDGRFHKSHTRALFLDHGEATKQNGGGVCLFQHFLDGQWIFFYLF